MVLKRPMLTHVELSKNVIVESDNLGFVEKMQ